MDARPLDDNRTAANERQVGGDHYKRTGGEEHWDRIWRLYGRGYFVGCVTKYVERYQLKNGIKDLEKAAHFLQKLTELEQRDAGAYKVQEEWNRGNGQMAGEVKLEVPTGPYVFPAHDGVSWPFAFANGQPPVVGGPSGKVWSPLLNVTELDSSDPNLGGHLIGDFEPLVKPTGWVGFTFEGSTVDTCMYRCSKCRERFTISPKAAPALEHKCSIDAAEAGPNYVNQG